jgi:uncharacterized heparinase superfamily protein
MLWQFNLHYFHYLPLLSAQEQQQVCQHWIRTHPMRDSVAWHPYTTSLRIVQWIKQGLSTPEILTSIYKQAAYLFRNLESYHPGNHYLENAKALVFAAHYLRNQGESSDWLARGNHILQTEFKDQLLPDGGYFERTPMYHALMLELTLDLLNLVDDTSPLQRFLRPRASAMLDFLMSVTHPNGELALFNDSTVEIAPNTATLADYAARLDIHSRLNHGDYRHSGFHIFRGDRTYLIVDAGPLGPDYLLAHAHADIFSFEFSLDQEKVFVDTGVYEYRAGALRDYARSTQAHNTVSIDHRSQAELWGSFRVARRWQPKDVQFNRTQDGLVLSGRFGGWAKLIGDELEHIREIELDSLGKTLRIRDTVRGRGKHHVSIPLHLGPAVNLQRSTHNTFGLTSGAAKLTLESSVGQQCPEQTVVHKRAPYFPKFGIKFEIDSVCAEFCQALPVQHTWTVSWG